MTVRTVFLLLLLIASAARAQDPTEDGHWPSFRGYRARGIAEGFEPPVEFDVPSGKNVRWRTAIPGLAHSSPVVWGDKVFVTSAVRIEGDAELSSLYGSEGYGAGDSVVDEGPHAFQVHCLDRATGAIVWTRTAHEGVPQVKRHPKSTHANPTPCCDARRVVAFFGSEGLYCYDHAGELVWKRSFGKLEAGAPRGTGPADLTIRDYSDYQWGFASSPVIYADRVVVQCDVQDQSFVAALDAGTGEEVWRTDRDEPPTWCTPTIHDEGARGQVVCNGYVTIAGYDLETGEMLWHRSGGGDVPVPTPVIVHDLIYLTSAHGRLAPLYAFEASVAGEVADDSDAIAFYHPRGGSYMQTPLVYGTELYACSDGGVLGCFDAETGEARYRERLGAGTTGFSASPIAAAGKLFFTSESGEVHVIAAGPEFQQLAVNDLGEKCLATPALSEGTLFFRTLGHVVAVGTDE